MLELEGVEAVMSRSDGTPRLVPVLSPRLRPRMSSSAVLGAAPDGDGPAARREEEEPSSRPNRSISPELA